MGVLRFLGILPIYTSGSGWDLASPLRGGPNFGPVKYVKEVSHVKHMHANSILVHFNFSSKLMVT